MASRSLVGGVQTGEPGVLLTKSKEHLSDSVAGKFVVVEYEKRDFYKRILGKVLLSNQDMNLEQIKVGLAWHYKKYQDEQTTTDRMKYSKAGLDARHNKRGLWTEHDPSPSPFPIQI